MATVRIAYTWSTGEVLEVYADSDLDAITDVGKAAHAEFTEAWSALDSSSDG